jgi:hypothetical protein
MVQSDEVEDIVAQFPGPITLVPSPVKWWIVTILGTAMTMAGILTVFVAVSQFREGKEGAGIGIGMGVFGTSFFGLATAVGVACLLPGRSFLRLDESGFEAVHPFRKQKFRWGEVSDFGLYRGKGSSFVMFRTASPRVWGKLNSILTGWDGGLPDTYGFEARDLVKLMMNWQSMAMRSRGPGFSETSPSLDSAYTFQT